MDAGTNDSNGQWKMNCGLGDTLVQSRRREGEERVAKGMVAFERVPLERFPQDRVPPERGSH